MGRKINKMFASILNFSLLFGGTSFAKSSKQYAGYNKRNMSTIRGVYKKKKLNITKKYMRLNNQKNDKTTKSKNYKKALSFSNRDNIKKNGWRGYTLITIGGILFLVATGLIVKKCLKNKMIPAIQSYVKEIAALSNDVDNNLDKLFEKLTDFCGCVIDFNNKYKKIDDKDAKIEGTTLWRSGFISSILGLISNYYKDYCKHKIDENVYKNFYFLGIYCCLRVLQIPILSDGIWTADLCNSIKIDSKTRDKAFQLSIEYIKAKLANKEGNYKKNLQKIFNPKNSNTLEKILLYDFGTMEAIEKKLK